MMSETVVTVEPGNRNNAQAPPPKPAAPQQSGAGPLSWITFNSAYFQSVPGLLKLIQLVSQRRTQRKEKSNETNEIEIIIMFLQFPFNLF